MSLPHFGVPVDTLPGETNRKTHKLFPFVEMAKNINLYQYTINEKLGSSL